MAGPACAGPLGQIEPASPNFSDAAVQHTFYSSLTFGVIVLHVTLRLIADLSSPFLSLFADWSCLSFLQNVV